MIERFEHKKVTWFDVVHPTVEEVRELFRETGLPAEFGNDLTSMTPRSESKALKNCLKLTLDFPIVKRIDINHPHEVKFLVTKEKLITVRFEDIQAVYKFGKEFEVQSLLKTNDNGISGPRYFLALLNHLYDGLGAKLDYLESKTQAVEEDIFDNSEKEVLFEISKINRRLITFRHTLGTHETVLEDLKTDIELAFGKEFVPAVDELISIYKHLMQRVLGLSNTVENLRNTNTALLTAKQNEVMKIFTIMAFITFPLSLFTSLFGMNTENTPLVGSEHGFWYIILIMTFISLCFFAYFRYKKWI